jgi:hypothetical protein
MTATIEGVTHIAAIVFYVCAFGMALIAHYNARLWARKISTVGIMLIAAGWLIFYIFISNLTFADVHMSVLWSRVFHYNTATWLFIMAFVIRRSEKYGVELALSRETHG